VLGVAHGWFLNHLCPVPRVAPPSDAPNKACSACVQQVAVLWAARNPAGGNPQAVLQDVRSSRRRQGPAASHCTHHPQALLQTHWHTARLNSLLPFSDVLAAAQAGALHSAVSCIPVITNTHPEGLSTRTSTHQYAVRAYNTHSTLPSTLLWGIPAGALWGSATGTNAVITQTC
jgi:hypothetical protein